MLLLRKLIYFFKWLVWDFSGSRKIWEKIIPPLDKSTNKRPPATFILWTIGIYVAFFGVASQRYENRIDIIENRANAIFAQLPSSAYKGALSRVAIVQNMPCPQKPNILSIISVFNSLFGEDTTYDGMVILLKETLENWKTELSSVNLSNANLEGANLSDANLQGAILKRAKLKRANLEGTNLIRANLEGANLIGVDISQVNLKDAVLLNALLRLDAHEAMPVITLEAEYKALSTVETLYGAMMHSSTENRLKNDYPNLFSSPFPESPSGLELIIINRKSDSPSKKIK